jgi:hypothetical protein
MQETLSKQELKELVEHTIDRRMEVWLVQLTDALIGTSEEDLPLQPEFAASLRRSLEQARSGKGVDLDAFREQLGR